MIGRRQTATISHGQQDGVQGEDEGVHTACSRRRKSSRAYRYGDSRLSSRAAVQAGGGEPALELVFQSRVPRYAARRSHPSGRATSPVRPRSAPPARRAAANPPPARAAARKRCPAATARGRTPPGSGARRLVQAGAGARGSRPACPRRRPRSCRADRPRRGGSRRWTRSPPRGRGRACRRTRRRRGRDRSARRGRRSSSGPQPTSTHVPPRGSAPRRPNRPSSSARRSADRRRTHRRARRRGGIPRRPHLGVRTPAEGSPSRRALRVGGWSRRSSGRRAGTCCPCRRATRGTRHGRFARALIATPRSTDGSSARWHASTRMAACTSLLPATAVWSVCASPRHRRRSPSSSAAFARTRCSAARRAISRGRAPTRRNGCSRCCARSMGQLITSREARQIERRIVRATTPALDRFHAPPTARRSGALSPAELRRLASTLGGARRRPPLPFLDLERLRDFEPSRGGSFANAASVRGRSASSRWKASAAGTSGSSAISGS